jgi:transcriptional regulator with GAF, ATPase, and Fis domain
VAQSGEPYLCHDTEEDPKYYKIKGNIRSEMAVPLRCWGSTIGVINLDSRKKSAFSDTQLETLQIVAGYATLLYTKISTIEKLEERVVVQNILIRVAEILNGADGLKEKFAQIMKILQGELKMERGTIVLRVGASDEYAISTAVGLSDEAIKKGVYKPGEGVTGKIIATGEPYAVREHFFLSGLFAPDQVAGPGGRAGRGHLLYRVPIKVKTNVIGVLSVDKPFDHRHFDANISLLTVIASLLAQALQVEEYSAGNAICFCRKRPAQGRGPVPLQLRQHGGDLHADA